jgi:hypothetical protein
MRVVPRAGVIGPRRPPAGHRQRALGRGRWPPVAKPDDALAPIRSPVILAIAGDDPDRAVALNRGTGAGHPDPAAAAAAGRAPAGRDRPACGVDGDQPASGRLGGLVDGSEGDDHRAVDHRQGGPLLTFRRLEPLHGQAMAGLVAGSLEAQQRMHQRAGRDVERRQEMLPRLPPAAVVRADPGAGVEDAGGPVDDGRRQDAPFDIDLVRVDVLAAVDRRAEPGMPQRLAGIGIPGVDRISHGRLVEDIATLPADRDVGDVQRLRLHPGIVGVQCQQHLDAALRDRRRRQHGFGGVAPGTGLVDRPRQDVGAHGGTPPRIVIGGRRSVLRAPVAADTTRLSMPSSIAAMSECMRDPIHNGRMNFAAAERFPQGRGARAI